MDPARSYLAVKEALYDAELSLPPIEARLPIDEALARFHSSDPEAQELRRLQANGVREIPIAYHLGEGDFSNGESLERSAQAAGIKAALLMIRSHSMLDQSL